MIARPMFAPHFAVLVVVGDGVFLVSEGGTRLFRGRLYERLAPVIDGRHTVHEIVDAMAPDVEAAAVYFAVNSLAEKGYIVEAATLHEPHSAIEILDVDDLAVVVTSDYLAAELRELNHAMLRSGRPWLLMKLTSPTLWFGPIFRPPLGACWECLAQRLRLHRPIDTYLESCASRTTYRRPAGAAPLPDRTSVARALADIDRTLLEGAVITRGPVDGQLERHQLVRRPNCPACGQPLAAGRGGAPIVLQPQRKCFRADGGHRTVTPEETLKRFGHHVSPITGIVDTLVRTPLDPGSALHVYTTGRNLGFTAPTLERLRAGVHTGSSGKGMTDVQARASGLSEAIERYSAVFQGDEPRTISSARALGDEAVHPASCMLFSPAQYAMRSTWNATSAPANRIPHEFDDTAAVEWSPVWSLTHDAPRYVPTALCYLGYPYAPGEPRTCVATSSGIAAGNTLEEACLQATLELVERDAVALWWYSRARRPGVALETFVDPRIEALRDVYAGQHRELWVLDLTSDFEVPVFAAISRRTDSAAEEIVLGFGAHLDPRVGILRALSEMNQGLAGTLGRRRSSAAAPADRDASRWAREATVANQPYLLPSETVPAHSRDGYRDASSDDLRDDVKTCRMALERRGLEMLALDLTRPDVAMPVIKVFVPGLRPYVPRFAAGRLYDVPVQLGWIPARLSEEQLNPLPMVP
jgi:ribosomal protein S12 methylthiotransferase accessory factor